MYTPNIPPLENMLVASDAMIDGRDEIAREILGLTEDDQLTTEDAEEWLDNLTLADVLGSEEAREVDWNGEEESTYDGRAIVIRDSRGFDKRVGEIVIAMIRAQFGDAADAIFADTNGAWIDDRFVDRLIYSREGTWKNGTPLEVYSSNTEICCECHNTLIHSDPYSGRDTSVFVDGEGFMCEECCAADPIAALHYAASCPELFSGSVEDFVDVTDEETTTRLHETGWRHIVVPESSLQRVQKCKETVLVDNRDPSNGYSTEASVWWSNRRLCDLR